MVKKVDNNKMERAAQLWAQGMSLAEIASKLKVARSTAYRWKLNPIFATLVSDHRYQAMSRCFDKCVDLQEQAIGTLGNLLRAKSPHIRLKAAQTITDMNYRYFIDKQASDEIIKLEEQILRLSPVNIPHAVPSSHATIDVEAID